MMFQVFARVLAVYLAMAIFNAINFIRALDMVYGNPPMNWKKIKVALKRVTLLPLPLFLMDWWIGLTNFNYMVECVRKARQKVRS